MAKTGSLAEHALALTVYDWQNKQEYEKEEIFKEYTKGLKRTLQVFKDLRKTGDIDEIVRTESALTGLEKTHFKNDPTVKASLEAATVDFSVIKKGLEVVRSPDYYQKVDDAYHSKRKVSGVPADGFHEAINAHITRLGNRIKSAGTPMPEKNILMARQENMRVAKGLYVELQQKALGVEAPEKANGLQM